jgi:hypothetical protein
VFIRVKAQNKSPDAPTTKGAPGRNEIQIAAIAGDLRHVQNSATEGK